MEINIRVNPRIDNPEVIDKAIACLQALKGLPAEESKPTAPEKVETPAVVKPPVKTPTGKATVPVKKDEPVTVKVDTPEEAEEVGGVEVTAEMLRAATQQKIQKGFRNEIAAKLKELGASNVSSIVPEKYQIYYKFLNALA